MCIRDSLLTATMSPMAAVLVMLVVPKERPAHKDKVARTVWQDLGACPDIRRARADAM